MRLLIVQYGNYIEALKARDSGAKETYRAQFHSLDAVDAILGRDGACLVVSLDAPAADAVHGAYRMVSGSFLPHGSGPMYTLRAASIARRIIRLAHDFRASHALLRTPGWVLANVGRWAVNNDIFLLPVLADLFPAHGWRNRLRNAKQIAVLNHPGVPVVGNHNYPACRSLEQAGVSPAKIVPWDWPPVADPADAPAKTLQENGPLKLWYAGNVSRDKGVFDLVRAVGLLEEKEPGRLHLDVCGDGAELAELGELVGSLGLEKAVDLHGRVDNQTVRTLLTNAQVAVVPSRHAYPEGLPNTIYEALETRTPLIVSDHPAFADRLQPETHCLIFPEKKPDELARTLGRLLESPELYARLSENSPDAWNAIQCPVTFAEMLSQWALWTRTGQPMDCLRHSLAQQESPTESHNEPHNEPEAPGARP